MNCLYIANRELFKRKREGCVQSHSERHCVFVDVKTGIVAHVNDIFFRIADAQKDKAAGNFLRIIGKIFAAEHRRNWKLQLFFTDHMFGSS